MQPVDAYPAYVTSLRFWPLAVLLLLAGCGGDAGAKSASAVPADWREIATPADRGRIRGWRDGWVAALARANRADSAKVRAEGVLLAPDAALDGVRPPPGDYRCRTIKLGARATGGLDYTAYPAFTCRIAAEGSLLGLTKLDGSQRPSGRLFPDGAARMIFLGAMTLGDEDRPLEYGRDPERDMIGALERIGDSRWRLVLPWPRWESMLDVIELVPVGG